MKQNGMRTFINNKLSKILKKFFFSTKIKNGTQHTKINMKNLSKKVLFHIILWIFIIFIFPSSIQNINNTSIF